MNSSSPIHFTFNTPLKREVLRVFDYWNRICKVSWAETCYKALLFFLIQLRSKLPPLHGLVSCLFFRISSPVSQCLSVQFANMGMHICLLPYWFLFTISAFSPRVAFAIKYENSRKASKHLPLYLVKWLKVLDWVWHDFKPHWKTSGVCFHGLDA